jgi:hypothetical protein
MMGMTAPRAKKSHHHLELQPGGALHVFKAELVAQAIHCPAYPLFPFGIGPGPVDPLNASASPSEPSAQLASGKDLHCFYIILHSQ